MPELTVVLSGTDTEVGKTWVGAELIAGLKRAGADVAARKPVQSFGRTDALTDAEVLGQASGERAEDVCPEHRWLAVPMAPPMAAEALGLPSFTIADLLAETTLPEKGLAIVEGVGGPRSPLAADGDTVSLAAALDADLVIVVATADLGAINSVLLSVEAFRARPVVVFLNRYDSFDELHRANAEWLATREGVAVITRIDELVWKVITATVGRESRRR
jgi:dethiobiotin synthetase